MKIKYGILFIAILPFFNFNYGSDLSNKFGKLKIYSDSESMDNVGYKNCNMKTNGESLVIKNLIKSEDVVFDIGADTGSWSQSVFSKFPSATIYAFEPLTHVFKKLRSKYKNKKFSAYNIAFSDYIGEAKFFYYPEYSRVSGFYDRDILREKFKWEPKEINIKVDTLDSFCQKNNILHIDFLKIDTEGEELKSYDYCIYRISKDGLINIPKWNNKLENYKYSNYLAILRSS